ncbi:hypothetical protein Egran_03455 [Elaphomyces granulatus]|uniref:DASH complex subunit DAD2 n=1 Tax=Elaphomyces granulatus TaxID=519963 RepID=A0A232LX89_9EURO|nr:hypothetical protein Egran_03455 [Elaphomyces granulatus]
MMANLPCSTSFPTGSSLRQTTAYSAGSQQSSALAARISLKRAELDNLKQLRDLSGALAAQMQALEEKIGMLKDGAEVIACVLANWDNVIQAISMASSVSSVAITKRSSSVANLSAWYSAKVVRMQGLPNEQLVAETTGENNSKGLLPATLVRIAAEQPEQTQDR